MILDRRDPDRVMTELGKYVGPGANPEGVPVTRLVSLLRSNNINAMLRRGLSTSQLEDLSNSPRSIVAVIRSSTDPDLNHVVIVDGLTQRGGRSVVAIRDPGTGTAYFESLTSFRRRFRQAGSTYVSILE